MDPITVVSFLAVVVQLIDVTSKAVQYFNDVKDAPKDRAKLAREAANILPLFTELRYRVEETTSTDLWFTGLRSLGGEGGSLMEFKTAMESIADKLNPATSFVNLKRVLRWTLDKREIDAILSKIERLKTLVGLALQKDHFKLSLAMKEEIKMGFQETRISRNTEKIDQWLAAPLPSSNHNAAMKKRQPTTGEWFTQSKEYADWKIRTNSFIWLHGIPGCGKTVLCSTITQDVISNYQFKPSNAVAYFYFDFNDSDKQSTEKLIRSLVVQLSSQCLHLPESLQWAYSRSQDGKKQPTIEDLRIILCHMLKIFDNTYILLDALDECTDQEDLLEFIETLMGWNIHDLHVLATSRKENDIATSLEPLITCQLCIQSALVDVDIRVHIRGRLSNDKKLNKWPANVRKEIENALMKDAKGMFRWVVCQLDSLRKCLTLDALRKALNTLPKTLDDTYERILSNLDEQYEKYALKIFQWLCFSMRPMRINEMVEVLAIDSTDDFSFSLEQRLPDPRDILIICSTLVSVTAVATKDRSGQSTGAEELGLAHFSVKEYLISDRLKKASIRRYHITPLSANVSIAKICLTYLLHFGSPTILTAEFDHEFPLIRYAAEFWASHYRSISDDVDREAVDFLGYDLVESKNFCFINWLRIFNPDARLSKSNLSLERNRISTPLYYMSHLGVSGVLKMLLNNGANVNAKGGIHGNALSAASGNGRKEVVRLLLGKGANVNSEDGIFGNALSAASSNGHKEVVRLLLENGANINAKGGFYGNALSTASSNGHEEVIRLLLEKGVNINAEGGFHGNALSTASHSGHEGVVRLLLEKGANVNANDNALFAASGRGHEGVVRLLLEKGVNVNAGDGMNNHALTAASGQGHAEVVQLLLEKGADVNAEAGSNGNALSAASGNGHKEVVRLLLEKGADVNAKGGFNGTALSAASCSGYKEVVQLLLDKGANVNAKGGSFGNALSAASHSGHEGVMRLLLEKEVNVNAKDNALLAASGRGHESTVRLLLEKGAEVNAEGGPNGNALSAASSEGHEGVVRLLLEKGADLNAQGGRALRMASQAGQKTVTRILLKNKADIALAFHGDGKALHGISVEDHTDAARET